MRLHPETAFKGTGNRLRFEHFPFDVAILRYGKNATATNGLGVCVGNYRRNLVDHGSAEKVVTDL